MRSTRLRRPRASLEPLIAFPATVAIVYFGKPVLLPLVLAALGAFVLTPLVRSLEQARLSRPIAVLLVVIFTGILLGSGTYGVAQQVGSLISDMPARSGQLAERMRSIREASTPIAEVSKTFERLAGAAARREDKTVYVETPESLFSGLFEYVRTATGPAATLLLTSVLLIFTLMRREDLRNRALSLTGKESLVDATRVLVTSTQRLSRMLAMQVAINFSLGAVFGIGLWLLGVPYWFLWAALAAVLRFVPFIGSSIAMLLPFTLCLMTFQGWGKPLAVLGLFIALSTVTANAIEPLLIGRRTGVTPIGLLLAAVFWTWLWGPVGLVVSTPLTLCLVVLGQHVPRLRFLSLLLGDEPPMSPFHTYYQRLLAGDDVESLEIARAAVKEGGPDLACDQIFVPALRRAARDHRREALTAEDEAYVRSQTAAISATVIELKPTPGDAPLVLGLPAHLASENVALGLLGRMLSGQVRFEVESTQTLASEIEERIAREKPAMVVVGVLPPRGVAQCQFLCTRLRAKFPELKILVGYWGGLKDFDKMLNRLRTSGASYLASTLTQTQTQVTSLIPVPAASAPATRETNDAAASVG